MVVIADRAIGPSVGLELIGLPSFGLKVCVWEGGAHEVQSKGLEASERACLTKAAGSFCLENGPLGPQMAQSFRCAGQMENVIMRFCLKCYFLPLPRGLLP